MATPVFVFIAPLLFIFLIFLVSVVSVVLTLAGRGCHSYPQGEPGLLGQQGPMGLPVSSTCVLACPHCQLYPRQCRCTTEILLLSGHVSILHTDAGRLTFTASSLTRVWVCTHHRDAHSLILRPSFCLLACLVLCVTPTGTFRGQSWMLSHFFVFFFLYVFWVFCRAYYQSFRHLKKYRVLRITEKNSYL